MGDEGGEKMAHASSFICGLRFIYFFFFFFNLHTFHSTSLHKETAAWRLLHLNLDAHGTRTYERTGSRPICLTVDLSLSRREMTDKGAQTMDDASRLSRGRNPLWTAAG